MRKYASYLRFFISGLLMVCALGQVFADVGADRKITASLVTEFNTPPVGEATALAVVMAPEEGWHGYWSNPGDAGFPSTLRWSLPEGVSVGAIKYPVPDQLVVDGIMNYIFHGEYALLLPLEIDKTIPVGTELTIKLDISYLVCNPEACLPEQQSLEKTFKAGAAGAAKNHQAQFNHWRQQLPKPIESKGRFAVNGESFILQLPLPAVMGSGQEMHVYPEINDMIVNMAAQNFARQGDQLFMQTTAGDDLGDSFQGVITVNDSVALQFSAELESSEALVFPTQPAAPAEGSSNLFFKSILALSGAILGGLLLNIMPCVFPILSLKILSLSKLSSEKEAKIGALAYTFGAVLACSLLGALILLLRGIGHQVGWAFQLQSPAIIVALILLMMAIAYNLAGLFEIGTLSFSGRLQSKSGPVGDFWTGVLAAFVATPCTGPFMATALGAALVLPIGVGLLIFAGLGFGMALPFLLIGFIPALRSRMPKPGRWMITAKQFLSVPMFLTGLALIWVLMRQADSDYVFMALSLVLLMSLGLWSTGMKQRSGRRYKWWPAILALLISAVTLFYVSPGARSAGNAENSQDSTIRFDEKQLTALVEKQDVFLYFSADWCLTCKVNEKTAIDREDTQAAFRDHNIAVMVGDWTNGDPVITEFLSEHDRSGVPLYLWYRKGENQPEVLPQILTPSLLIEKAEN